MKALNLIYLLIIASLIACSDRGTRLVFNEGELFYTKSITEDEANKLGNYLVGAGFFDGNKKTVQLDVRNDTLLFRMVTEEDKREDRQFEAFAYFFGAALSKSVFDGRAIEVHLCDEYLESITIVKTAKMYLPEGE